MLPKPLFENKSNFTLNKNRVFQDEIVINFFHIHCELRSIIRLGGLCASSSSFFLLFFYKAWNPLPLIFRVKGIPNADLVQAMIQFHIIFVAN